MAVLYIFLMLSIEGIIALESYKLVLERVVHTNYINEVMIGDFKLFKVNRTTIALNMTYDVLQDVTYSKDDIMEVQTYEFLNNQYKPFAVNFRRVYCEFLKAEYKMLFGRDCPNLIPTKCPVKKGFYYAYNYIPPASRFVNMPFNRMKYEQRFYRSEVLHYKVEVFVLFDRDVVYRENFNE